MPLYVFECAKCERQIERLQKYSDPVPTCDKCNNTKMERQIARTSFKLKGAGWAVDGYAKR